MKRNKKNKDSITYLTNSIVIYLFYSYCTLRFKEICGVKNKSVSGDRLAVSRVGPLVDKTHFKVAGTFSAQCLPDTLSRTLFDPKTENTLHTYVRAGQFSQGKLHTHYSKLIISNNYKFKLFKFVYCAVVVTAAIVLISRGLCCHVDIVQTLPVLGTMEDVVMIEDQEHVV